MIRWVWQWLFAGMVAVVVVNLLVVASQRVLPLLIGFMAIVIAMRFAWTRAGR